MVAAGLMGVMARARKPPGPRKTWDSRAAEDRIRAYVKRYMREHELSQQAMGDLVGVDDSTISRLLRGKRGVAGLPMLLALRQLWNQPIDWIVDGKAVLPEPPPPSTSAATDGRGTGPSR